MIRHFAKGDDTQVSEHFKAREFDCACSDHLCVTEIDAALIDLLEKLRVRLQLTISIHSGFRCPRYQRQLQERGYPTAVGLSQHEVGGAADLSAGALTGAQLEPHARAVGFKAVGVAPSWVHVDIRDDKVRRWTYPK